MYAFAPAQPLCLVHDDFYLAITLTFCETAIIVSLIYQMRTLTGLDLNIYATLGYNKNA